MHDDARGLTTTVSDPRALEEAGVGKLFGPVMCTWFASLGALGLGQIIGDPSVLRALNPAYALSLFASHGWQAFVALGARLALADR